MSSDNKSTSAEALGAMAVGGATGLGGFAATEYALTSQLLPFDTKVANETVEEIKRMRLAGGLAAGGSAMTDGASFAGGVIKEKVYLNMLAENGLARFLHNIGGRSIVSLGAAAVTGLIGLGIGWMAFVRRSQPDTNVVGMPQPQQFMLPPGAAPQPAAKDWGKAVSAEQQAPSGPAVG